MGMPFAQTAANTNDPMQAVGGRSGRDVDFIDGTPMATAILVLAAAGVLVALKSLGFRFVVGVGGK